MPNIDELTIQFKQKGVGTIVKNINALASAVESLSNKSQGLDAGKISALASALGELKGNVPTKTQVTNLENLATAISSLNAAAGSGNITTFANDISSVSSALNGIKGTPSKAIDKVTESLKEASVEAKHTAESIKGVEKSSADEKEQDKPKLNISGTTEIIAQFAKINGHLTKASDMATKFGSELRNMKVLTPTKQMKSLQEQTEKVRNKYEELRSTMLKATQALDFDPSSKSWEKQQKELDALRNKYDELILKQKELSLAGGGFHINPAIMGTLNAFGQGFTKVTSIVKSGFTSALQKANSVLGSLVKNMFRLVTASKAVKSAGNNVKDLAKKLSSELLRLSKMLKLMITRMALRTVIKEVGNGFKSLALHSKEFDKTMSDVINASKQLGYSFASMVAPLLNALAPAILYVIRILTNLVNAINQVISAMRGLTTWNKAIAFTDKWSDSIKNAGKSGSKAAKELKKTVLAFDELNQLQDNKNSGGGSDSDIKDMFETVEIDPKWKEFADWLDDMWNDKDFTKLGTLIGTRIKDVLDSIPWDEIRQTSNDIGKCIATLINGLVEVEGLGYSIGRTLAQGVNTVFEFFNGLVHNLHWDSIGKFIADTFNGFFESIDWDLIKDTVVTGMAGLAESIQNFIDTFHWDNISDFIINGIDTVVSGIRAFFEGIDWSDLGQKIGDQITKVLKGANWKNVGIAIGDMLQAAIDFVAGIVDNLNADDVVKALGDFWQGITEKVDFKKAGETLGKALQLIKDVLIKFWDEHGDEVLEKFHEFFSGLWENLDDDLPKLLGIAWDIGKAIISEIINAVKDQKGGFGALLGLAFAGGLAKMAGFITKEIAKIGLRKILTDGLFGGSGGTGLIATIGQKLAAAGSKIVSWVGSLGSNIASGLSTATTAISSWFTADIGATVASGGAAAGGMIASALVGGITAFLGGAEFGKKLGTWIFPNDTDLYEHYSGIKGTFELVKDTAVTLTERTGEHISNAWGNVKEATKTFAERSTEHFGNFKENAAKAFDGVDDKVNAFGDMLNQKKDDIKASIGNVKDNIAEKVGEIKGKFDDLRSGVAERIDGVKTKFEDLRSNATDKLGSFASTVKEKFETAKSFVNHVDWGRVLDNVKTSINNLKDNATTNLGAFSTTVKEKFDAARKFVNDTDWGKVIDTVKTSINGLKTDATSKLSDFSNTVKDKFEAAKNAIKNVDWGSLFNEIKNKFGTLVSDASSKLSEFKSNISSKLEEAKQIFSTFKDNIAKAFGVENWTFSGVAEGLQKTFEGAKSAVKNVWNSIAEKLNGEHDIGESKIRINLPKFAKGGMVEDGLFMANHTELVGTFSNGKTAVANNAQIVEGIQSGVYNAVISAMGQTSGNSGYILNEIIVDGEVIARSITKAQEKANRRYSPQTT